MGMATERWGWIEQWMTSEGLRLDGHAPVAGGRGMHRFMQCEAAKGLIERGRDRGDNVRLRTKMCDAMPVFTVAWSVDRVACSINVLDLHLCAIDLARSGTVLSCPLRSC